MLTAAYPSWASGEETFRLYQIFLQELDARDGRAAVMEIIRSPREFAPPVGILLDLGKQFERRRLEHEFWRERWYEPGSIAYTPDGQRCAADADGHMQPAPEPEPPAISDQRRDEIAQLVGQLAEQAEQPRIRARIDGAARNDALRRGLRIGDILRIDHKSKGESNQ